MWPRLLLEILPHFSRLVPVWDKYIAGRNDSDKALEGAMATLSGDVRGQLRHVAEEQAGIRGQLQEQSKQVAQVAVDVARTRMGLESVEERVARLEKTAAVTIRLLWVTLGLLAVVVVLLILRWRS
jgi:chromosome segregation ATPase